MARKAIVKTTLAEVENSVSEIDSSEISENTNENEIVQMFEKSIAKELVTTVRNVKTMKLDDYHDIEIEVSSDYWVRVYWTNGNMKSLLVLFEINHSTTDFDICRDSKKYVHDKFIYLAQKTFLA